MPQQAFRLGLEAVDLLDEVQVAAVAEEPQLLDLALKLGKRTFEVEKAVHFRFLP